MVDDHDVDEVDYDHDGEFQDAMTVSNLICNTYFQTKDFIISVLASSAVDREFEHRVKPKASNLVFVVSPLSTHH